MNPLPNLKGLSSEAKDALIEQLWQNVKTLQEQVQGLQRQLEAQSKAPKKTAENSSIPPSRGFKPNLKLKQPPCGKRQASVGREGGERGLHPEPDQTIVARLKQCPQCGEEILPQQQQLRARYDKIELSPIAPHVTRIERYGGHCTQCQQTFVASVPVGLEPGSPFGQSVESLVTYLRYNHAISYQRLSQMIAEVFGLTISEGGIANLFERVKSRLDGQVQAILTRLQQSRFVCSDETSARVNGQTSVEMGVSKSRPLPARDSPLPWDSGDYRSAANPSSSSLGFRFV